MRFIGPRRSSGFTLLEVLVALSILALSYGVILNILGGAARKVDLTGDYRQAMIVAESRLDYAAADVDRRDLQTSGVSSQRYAWQVTVTPTDVFSVAGVPSRYTTVVVNVDVSWEDAGGSTRSIALSTIRLRRRGVSG